MAENSSQKDLKYIPPQLYKEFQKKNVECLSDYRVEWIRLKVYIRESDLEILILNRMFVATTEGLRIQRGREYGFYGDQFAERAANISDMRDDDLQLFPSNNLICERSLS